MNYPLTQFLDDLLGAGDNSSGSNRKFLCPFPGCQNRPSRLSGEKKLEVDQETSEKGENKWACWSCKTKGKTIKTLLHALKAPSNRYDELSSILKYTVSPHAKTDDSGFDGKLPAEYKFLGDVKKKDIEGRHALKYLKKRGFTIDDVYKYNIGYCEEGKYQGRIIIPSYDSEGKINYFIARSYDEECPMNRRYLNPKSSREIVPFDLYINWEEPIVLCEGAFDMMAIKRNAIPLMDKVINDGLFKKIMKMHTKKIYIAIDKDAFKLAIECCKTFMDYGKKVFFVPMDDKDPAKMGFESFTELIQHTQALTVNDLVKLKLSII